MKRKVRRALAILLAMAMVFAMAACGGGSDSNSGSGNDGGNQSNGENQSSAGNSGQGSDEEPYEIVVETMGSGLPMADVEEVEAAINELTLPAINCTVKFRDISIGDHATQMGLLGSDGERLDIIYVGYTTSMANLQANGLLLGLGDLLEENAPELLEKAGPLMEACYVDDDYYCIPGDFYPASQTVVLADKEIFDQYQIEIPENPEATDEYIDKLYANVKASDFDGYCYTPGDGTQVFMLGYQIEKFGAGMGLDAAYGVLMDMTDSSDTTIVNLYDTDEYLQACLRAKRWRDDGTMVPDSLTSGNTLVSAMRAGQVCASISTVNSTFTNNTRSITGRDSIAVPIDDLVITGSSIPEYGLGVTVTSERPDKAVQLLNMIMTNADLANLMNYGIEGKHYVKVSDHIITYPEGVDVSTIGYGTQINSYGDSSQIYHREPFTEEWYEEVKKYGADNAKLATAFGYVFNPDSVKTQVAAVSAVIGEYQPSLACGMVEDVEGRVAEFREALQGAGIAEIIAENQRQFDEWLANKQ